MGNEENATKSSTKWDGEQVGVKISSRDSDDRDSQTSNGVQMHQDISDDDDVEIVSPVNPRAVSEGNISESDDRPRQAFVELSSSDSDVKSSHGELDMDGDEDSQQSLKRKRHGAGESSESSSEVGETTAEEFESILRQKWEKAFVNKKDHKQKPEIFSDDVHQDKSDGKNLGNHREIFNDVEEEIIHEKGDTIPTAKLFTEGRECNSRTEPEKRSGSEQRGDPLREYKKTSSGPSASRTEKVANVEKPLSEEESKAETVLKEFQEKVSCASPGVEFVIRENLKDSEEYKKAEELEWLRRQSVIEKEAAQARKDKAQKKLEEVQQRRVQELRSEQEIKEKTMQLKLEIQTELQTSLRALALNSPDMASLLRSLQILEITPNLTEAQVKSAYKKATLKFHPDRVAEFAKGDPRKEVEAEEIFKLIQTFKSTKPWISTARQPQLFSPIFPTNWRDRNMSM